MFSNIVALFFLSKTFKSLKMVFLVLNTPNISGIKYPKVLLFQLKRLKLVKMKIATIFSKTIKPFKTGTEFRPQPLQ